MIDTEKLIEAAHQIILTTPLFGPSSEEIDPAGAKIVAARIVAMTLAELLHHVSPQQPS